MSNKNSNILQSNATDQHIFKDCHWWRLSQRAPLKRYHNFNATEVSLKQKLMLKYRKMDFRTLQKGWNQKNLYNGTPHIRH
jgi:hypothetical protein